MSDAYNPPRQPTLIEWLLQKARAGQGGPGPLARANNQVQAQADSVGHFRNNAMPAFIGQNGPIAPPDPFSGGQAQVQMPGPAPQSPTVTVNPQPNYGNPQFAESAFPGGGAPNPTVGPGPTVRSPQDPGLEAMIAQMIQADPNAFQNGSPPPAEALPAFADVPVGDTLNIQNPWPVTPPQGGPQPQMAQAPAPMPPPMSGGSRPVPAPPTAAVAPPIMPTPMRPPMTDPFAAFQGGPPPVAPRPFAAAPAPTAVSPPTPVTPRPTLPPQGMLRRPPPQPDLGAGAYAIAPMSQGLSPELLANSFLHAQPEPPGGPPKPAAAQIVKSPPVVPPAQGGAQVTPPAPTPGAKMPEHLKDQLLAEAVRLTAKKRGTSPAGAP